LAFWQKLFLADLIAYRAGCFTGRLARSLAFAAAACSGCLNERRIINCLDMLAHVDLTSLID